MAIALVKCAAFGENTDNLSTKRGVQVLKMVLTGAAADVSYDISNASGTFWGDVDNTAAGVLAKALVVTDIVAKAQALTNVEGDFTIAYDRGAAAASGIYTLSVTGKLPTITFNTAEAPTSMVLVLKWSLADNATPITTTIL